MALKMESVRFEVIHKGAGEDEHRDGDHVDGVHGGTHLCDDRAEVDAVGDQVQAADEIENITDGSSDYEQQQEENNY